MSLNIFPSNKNRPDPLSLDMSQIDIRHAAKVLRETDDPFIDLIAPKAAMRVVRDMEKPVTPSGSDESQITPTKH